MKKDIQDIVNAETVVAPEEQAPVEVPEVETPVVEEVVAPVEDDTVRCTSCRGTGLADNQLSRCPLCMGKGRI